MYGLPSTSISRLSCLSSLVAIAPSLDWPNHDRVTHRNLRPRSVELSLPASRPLQPWPSASRGPGEPRAGPRDGNSARFRRGRASGRSDDRRMPVACLEILAYGERVNHRAIGAILGTILPIAAWAQVPWVD